MRSLWVNPQEQSFPSLEAGLTVDVAIVGAGFSGLGAAHALRDLGCEVAVLEERTVASGATGRNAGFVLAGPAMPYLDAISAIGVAETAQIWELTLDNNRTIARLVEDHAIDCGYLRRGSMSLAASEEEWVALQNNHAALSSAGIGVCLVAASDLPRPFDELYSGGLYHAGNAELDPGRFCRGIARRVTGKVRIYEGTRVLDLASADRWALRTPGGTVYAGTVIIATNAYTARLLTSVPIQPTRGQVLATEPVPYTLVPFPLYADHGYQYWRQTAEGALVVGGWRNLDLPGELGTGEVIHPHIQRALDQFVARIAPFAPRVLHRWAGIMGFTPDMFPLVGPVPDRPGLSIAAGYSGHGVAMAFTCGARIALQSVGQEVSIPRAFAPDRFSAPPQT